MIECLLSDTEISDDENLRSTNFGFANYSGKENALFILDQISKYPFDLFKINVSHLFNKIVKENLVAVANYLDSRCFSTSFLT